MIARTARFGAAVVVVSIAALTVATRTTREGQLRRFCGEETFALDRLDGGTAGISHQRIAADHRDGMIRISNAMNLYGFSARPRFELSRFCKSRKTEVHEPPLLPESFCFAQAPEGRVNEVLT